MLYNHWSMFLYPIVIVSFYSGSNNISANMIIVSIVFSWALFTVNYKGRAIGVFETNTGLYKDGTLAFRIANGITFSLYAVFSNAVYIQEAQRRSLLF